MAKRRRSLSATEWIGHGTGRLFRRDALPTEHEESWQSLWIKKYGDLNGFPTEDGQTLMLCQHCKKHSVVDLPFEDAKEFYGDDEKATL